MAGKSGVDQIQCGPFCLDVNGSPVFRDGADLKLRPQAVRVLKALLGRPGQSMDYEKLLQQPRGTTFVSRHSVATTLSEMRKTLEECSSRIGYRLRFGYSLNIPRSDDQIRTGWHLSEPRSREEMEKTLSCFQHGAATDPVRPPPTKALAGCI
jgi:DNA-binding winged helix-turn-helix (wHTH) protein